MSYKHLTEVEKAHLDEYRNLRSISDWPGFTASQEQRKREVRQWIEKRRKEIGAAIIKDQKNNQRLHRKERLSALSEPELRRGGAHRQTELPSAHCTPREKALIEEREFYFAVKATTTDQKRRKAENRRELVAIRKKLWALLQDPKEKKNSARLHRERRWKNICVATKKGSAYFTWKRTHNTVTGDTKKDATTGVEGSSTRQAIIRWHKEHEGISEQPPGSNCDNRKDGIRNAQYWCADQGTWLYYTPWCGSWTHEGYRRAGIEAGSWLASVSMAEDYARRSLGPYKSYTAGFTTRAKQGDSVILFGRGVHIATIERVMPTGYWTREGNTSPGDGSQSDGGWAGPRFRAAAEVHGVCHLAVN